MDINEIIKIWAKTGQDDANRFHPLLCHMLDVAAVTAHFWDQHLSQSLRSRLCQTLEGDARSLVMFIAGAHDIGKASPAFQKRVPALSRHLNFPFSINDNSRPHGFISACVLPDILGRSSLTVLLGRIAGGHHGIFPRSVDLRLGRDTLGNSVWEDARDSLLRELARALAFRLGSETKCKLDMTDPLVVPLLAGFISVADWIGSNQEYFPCMTEAGKQWAFNTEEYFTFSQDRARKALYELGWMPGVTFSQEAPFDYVFHGFEANSVQSAVIGLASKQSTPYLMIVEAPTGEGKTEAALYAADLATSRGFASGIYVAMPTQATGNAMYARVQGYLKHRGHKGRLNLQLVHSDALLARAKEVKEGEFASFETKDIDIEEQDGDTEAQSWFMAQKRPLLAPFGVGTIDQSLLSVLQTKHWFVRLFGLVGKVIIFDEVHAYDAYMSAILERLLSWLAEMDCTVILLSATLPEVKRTALIQAYAGRSDAEYKRYPRISLAHPCHYPQKQAEQMPMCVEVPAVNSRSVRLDFSGTDLESVSSILMQRLEHGGCAAVVCNTVDRSIEMYKHLRDNLKETECILFHARTTQMWRREREKEVLRLFGKGARQDKGVYINLARPKRAVLVATQVIEQSLDLDFDLMLSEIAPIDLLIQRMGRLQRHARSRPQGLETPEFVILCDGQQFGPPPVTFGKNAEYVYDRFFLLRTWLVLREREIIITPSETEELIEAVYGTDDNAPDGGWSEALRDARKNMEFGRSESTKAASGLLIREPGDPLDLIDQFNSQLTDDDDPNVHKAVRAATREGDPSITVVIADEKTELSTEPAAAEVRSLLDRSVKLSHRGIYHVLSGEQHIPKEWSKSPYLKYARLLRLDVRNQIKIEGYILTADEQLGIVIEKESAESG